MADQHSKRAPGGQVINISGERFGMLTAVSFVGTFDGNAKWTFICDCGATVTGLAYVLKRKENASCGCAPTIKSNHIHGLSETAEHKAYCSAMSRCRNSRAIKYKWYGGRGIEFRYNDFVQFFEDVGLKPTTRHSLDRIDVDGHYEPGNVKWSTQKEQMRNVRTNRLIATPLGDMLMTDAAHAFSLAKTTLSNRINRLGWCSICACTLKPRGRSCPHVRTPPKPPRYKRPPKRQGRR